MVGTDNELNTFKDKYGKIPDIGSRILVGRYDDILIATVTGYKDGVIVHVNERWSMSLSHSEFKKSIIINNNIEKLFNRN